MSNIDSVKTGAALLRTLKVLTYLAGFPLLLFAAYQSVGKIGGYAVTAGAAATGFKVLAAGFAAVAAVQIIVGLTLKKRGFLTRAFIVAVAAFGAVFAPLIYTETVVRADFDALRAQYAEEGYDFAPYEKQVSDYAERAAGRDAAFNGFMSRYNLSGLDGSTRGGNLDATPTVAPSDKNAPFLKGFEDFSHYIFGAEAGSAVYSINGLYADSYVFGYNQAKYILETYYATRDAYAEKGLDADIELQAALDALDADGSVWKRYQQTVEYLRAYGDGYVDPDATVTIGGKEYNLKKLRADNYYLTVDEVKDMVDKLFAELGQNRAMADLVALINGAVGILGIDLPEGVTDILNDYNNLDYDALMSAIAGLNIEIGGKPLNEETLLGYISEYSFYQSPSSYPKMFFIDDAALRDYAYAKYLATKHGAVVGSVLLGQSVGLVSLDNLSGAAPMSAAQLERLFKKIEIENSYMPKYYPWLAIRGDVLKLGGIVPVAIFIAYALAYAENKKLDKLIAGRGGAKKSI
ncbi:MAG: hypothetical protein LBQ40_01625 [Clostridiales bacterium]|jgi:hypothetical protein|nr:hypothetical protein [Clostridiales bacterium]